MPSRRFVDRGFWRCQELNKLGSDARLLAIYLFSDEADDFGRLREDSYHLRHCCFPDSAHTDDGVVRMISALVGAGFLARYFSRAGKPLLWIRRFQDYQPMRYWAISRLDRHPDDEFEAFDTKKGIREARPLAPMGRLEETCANVAESGAGCANPRQPDAPIPIPIPAPAPDAAPSRARGGPGAEEATTTTKDTNGAFDGADDVKAASVVWNAFSCECRAFNGHDEPSRLASTAIARGMMGTHEGRVTALAAVWVTIKDTQKKPKEAWATLRERLRNKGGGKRVWQAGRKWAKTFTG